MSCFSNFSRSQSGSMTAEEFHSALQEATNYSLKGFVLPHLKQQLPSLQRDLSNAARASNQVSCCAFFVNRGFENSSEISTTNRGIVGLKRDT